MIHLNELTGYIDDVRGRLTDKRCQIDALDENTMNSIDRVKKILQLEQMDTYIEFINEFERIMITMDDCK